ncbi:MAG: hypothetical protein QOH67_1579 [Hyphomicrobiales bacterium]|jgi:hypothetical protein|nr:hypothetical protein [Hyphomicrobiales bacterium]
MRVRAMRRNAGRTRYEETKFAPRLFVLKQK